MEVYRSQDGQVSKYVHDDGSETAIKTVSSCGNIFNKATGKIEPVEVDRNKFTVFISSSVGCPVGCTFCYLTAKKFPYYRLTPDQIKNNVLEALAQELEYKPEIRNKYIKPSWMGMGDAFLLEAEAVRSVSLDICGEAIRQHGIVGIDGVDISTCMPKVQRRNWPHLLGSLNEHLHKFNINPTAAGRSPLRLFYSLHGVTILDRLKLIPLTTPNAPVEDLIWLGDVGRKFEIDIILHHMLLEGINDTVGDVNIIRSMIEKYIPKAELRILRYNECPNAQHKESSKFDELVKMYADNLYKVKYQTSAGSEIKAACGQFLCLKKNEEKQSC